MRNRMSYIQVEGLVKAVTPRSGDTSETMQVAIIRNHLHREAEKNEPVFFFVHLFST